jgi:hypothetical protein
LDSPKSLKYKKVSNQTPSGNQCHDTSLTT